MTPKFAESVDPLFLYVLRLLDRLDKGEVLSADTARRDLKVRLDNAESRLGQSPEWKLAKYALVCWIDEVLVDAPWEESAWWANNVLEFELFSTSDRYHQFYTKAIEAGTHARRDALEVFYLAVVLGFRGLYRDAFQAQSEAAGLNLPPNLETWARQTAMAIASSQPPMIDQSGAPGPGAPD